MRKPHTDPIYEGIKPHTDLTDLTEFARLMLNLTEALRTHAPKAHTDPTDLTGFFFDGVKSHRGFTLLLKKDTYLIHLNPIYTD